MLIIMSVAVSAAGIIVATGTSTDLRIEVIKYDPAPAEPGALMDLWLKVYTQGSTISSTSTLNDVKVSLLEEFPFSAASRSELMKSLGTMSPGETREIRFKVKVDSNANPGTNELKFQVSSSNMKEVVTTPSFEIDIESVSATIAIVSVESDPEQIPSGEKASIKITLRNDALLGLKDISAKLDLSSASTPFAPIHSTTEKKIRYLKSGESTDIFYDVIALSEADAKVYKIPFSLTYYDDAGNRYNKSDIIGLIVSTKPDLKVTLEDYATFQAGASGKVVISVANTGPSNLKFMTLRLEGSPSYKILGKSQEYMGNLDSDDFETAEFSINVNKDAVNSVPLNVKMMYRDSYNEQKEDSLALGLPVYTQGQITSYGLDGKNRGLLVPILLLAALAFAYFSVKDWKKNHSFDSAMKSGFEGIFIAAFKVLFLFRWRNLKRLPARMKLFFQKV